MPPARMRSVVLDCPDPRALAEFYQGVIGAGSLVAGVWAGLAWHGNGRIPLVISGTVVAALAIVLLVGGKRLERPART